MATKKKAKKKAPAKRVRKVTAAKKTAKKKASRGTKGTGKPVARISQAPKKPVRATRQIPGSGFSVSGKVQNISEDAASQGLSDVESADSESVGELLEEGNTFEAGVVRGVEQADDADEREVRTHEVLEDDVPEEYLDND